MNYSEKVQEQLEDFRQQINRMREAHQRSLLLHYVMGLHQIQTRPTIRYPPQQTIEQLRRWSSQRLHGLAHLLDPDKAQPTIQPTPPEQGEVIETTCQIVESKENVP